MTIELNFQFFLTPKENPYGKVFSPEKYFIFVIHVKNVWHEFFADHTFSGCTLVDSSRLSIML